LRIARAVDERRLFLAHFDALRLTEVGSASLSRGKGRLLRDDGAAGQDRDVFEHRLRRSPKPGALLRTFSECRGCCCTTRVRERFAFDFLGDDQQRTAGLGDLARAPAGRSRMFEIFLSCSRT
jgi:hypothetical protein